MNIGILRLSAIGDCALLLPAVKALLRQEQQVQVHWIIGRAAYQLFKGVEHPRLQFIVIDKPRSFKDYWALKKRFKNTKFDVLLAMQASIRANLIYPLIPAKTTVGFDDIRSRDFQKFFIDEQITFDDEHLHESFKKFIQKAIPKTDLAVIKADWDIPLVVDDVMIKKYQLPPRYVVINPAASKPERSWFAEHYAKVIDALYQRYNLQSVLTGASSDFELELSNAIFDMCQNKPLVVTGKTNLQELAWVLKHADFCITPDTGPAHIANGVGCKVIGLYAVAPSKLSGPYHHKVLTIDKFNQAVEVFLHKDPQQIAWKTRVHNRQAMNLISVDEVMTKVSMILEG